MLLKKTRYPILLPILSIFDPEFENEQEIVYKIVTLTIFTFVKGVKLILSGKNTRI
jgi:hypothetical protein